MKNIILETKKNELRHIASILDVLNSSSFLMSKISDIDLINSSELISCYSAWIDLVRKYSGLEKDFFSPYWVPISKNNYSLFIDISDSNYSVIEYFHAFRKPFPYSKIILFNSINDLLLLDEGDDSYNLKESRFNQRINSLAEYKKLKNNLISKKELELPEYAISKIEIENKKILIHDFSSLGVVKFENVNNRIVRFLPVSLNIKHLEFREYITYGSISNVYELIHFFEDYSLVEYFKIELENNTQVLFENSILEVKSSDLLFLKEFVEVIKQRSK